MDGQFQYPAIAGDLDSRWRFKGASRGRGPRATLDWYSGTCLHALGRRMGDRVDGRRILIQSHLLSVIPPLVLALGVYVDLLGFGSSLSQRWQPTS